ncbi:transposase [Streptomyces wuyuanensis]
MRPCTPSLQTTSPRRVPICCARWSRHSPTRSCLRRPTSSATPSTGRATTRPPSQQIPPTRVGHPGRHRQTHRPRTPQNGHFPHWLLEHRRAEQGLIPVVSTAYLLDIPIHRLEEPAESPGVTQLSKSQVSAMTKRLDEQVTAFRNRPLDAGPSTFVRVDAPTRKIREDGRTLYVHALVAVGVNTDGPTGTGRRPALTALPSVEPYPEGPDRPSPAATRGTAGPQRRRWQSDHRRSRPRSPRTQWSRTKYPHGMPDVEHTPPRNRASRALGVDERNHRRRAPRAPAHDTAPAGPRRRQPCP